MKLKFFVVLVCTSVLSFGALAAEKGKAKRDVASDSVQCAEAAMKAARFIDDLGWGTVKSEPLTPVSATRTLSQETIKIKSTVSGFTYTVELEQDYRSLACIVLNISTGN